MVHLIDTTGTAWAVPEAGFDLLIARPLEPTTQLQLLRLNQGPVILWAGPTKTARALVPELLRRLAEASSGDGVSVDEVEAQLKEAM